MKGFIIPIRRLGVKVTPCRSVVYAYYVAALFDVLNHNPMNTVYLNELNEFTSWDNKFIIPTGEFIYEKFYWMVSCNPEVVGNSAYSSSFAAPM